MNELEFYVGFCGGFTVAYLLIRALRSVSGVGLGCFVFCMVGVGVRGAECDATNWKFMLQGADGAAYSVEVLYQNTGSSWQSLQGRDGYPTCANGTLNADGDYGVQISNSAWFSATHGWRVKRNGVQAGGNSTYTVDGSGTPFTKYFSASGPSSTFTNYTASFSYTNNSAQGGWYVLQLSTNGVAAGNPTEVWLNGTRTDGGVSYPGDVFNFGATNAFGAGVDFEWTLSAPGSQATDYVRQVVNAGSATGSGSESSAGGSNSVSANYRDPFEALPQYTPTATNQFIADRQNAQGIVEAVGKQGQAQVDALQSLVPYLEGIRTNSSGTGTNIDYSDVLSRIQTNTLSSANTSIAATNLLTAATNILQGATNVTSEQSGLATNSLSSYTQNVTTAFNSTVGTAFDGWSNAVVASSSSWTTPVSDVVGNPLAMAILRGPTSFVLDFDAFSGTWGAKLLGPASFIQRLMIGLILMGMFWICYSTLQERIRETWGYTIQVSGRTPGGAPWSLYLKVLVGTVILEAGTVILTLLPTIMVGFMDGVNWTEPLPESASIWYQLGAGGGVDGGAMDSAIRRFVTVLGAFLPWVTAGTALVNWVAFRLLLDRLTNLVLFLGRALGVATALWLVCNLGLSCQGATIVSENLTGAGVLVSNSVEVVELPAGVSQVRLEGDVDWNLGTNITFQVTETGVFDPIPIVRVARDASDTNSPAAYLVWVGEGLTASVGFYWGWWLGLGCFGFAWIVCAVRRGLSVGWRGWGSD